MKFLVASTFVAILSLGSFFTEVAAGNGNYITLTRTNRACSARVCPSGLERNSSTPSCRCYCKKNGAGIRGDVYQHCKVHVEKCEKLMVSSADTFSCVCPPDSQMDKNTKSCRCTDPTKHIVKVDGADLKNQYRCEVCPETQKASAADPMTCVAPTAAQLVGGFFGGRRRL